MNRIALFMMCGFSCLSAMENILDDKFEQEIEDFKKKLNMPLPSRRIQLSDNVSQKIKEFVLANKKENKGISILDQEVPKPIKPKNKKQTNLPKKVRKKQKKQVNELSVIDAAPMQRTLANKIDKQRCFFNDLTEAIVKSVEHRQRINQLLDSSDSINDFRLKSKRSWLQELKELDNDVKKRYVKYNERYANNALVAIPEGGINHAWLINILDWVTQEEHKLTSET